MLVSRNELGAAMAKAVAGLGGDAADAADAGMLIACCASIDHATTNGFMDDALASLRYLETNPDDGALCAPLAAIRILDFVMAEGEWQGRIMGAGFLVAGMVLLGHAEPEAELSVSDSGGIAASLKGGEVMARDKPLPDGDYIIRTAETADALSLTRPGESQGAVEVEESRWNELLDYAALSYVAETEESRKHGAGAGDIDND